MKLLKKKRKTTSDVLASLELMVRDLEQVVDENLVDADVFRAEIDKLEEKVETCESEIERAKNARSKIKNLVG